jgi:hypothetical protein
LECLIFIEPSKCASHWSMKSCSIITDRESCLTSIESRHKIVQGVEIFGSDCGWCEAGPCRKGSSSMCEPVSMLQAMGTVEYATCLEIKENGRKLNDNNIRNSKFFVTSQYFCRSYYISHSVF